METRYNSEMCRQIKKNQQLLGLCTPIRYDGMITPLTSINYKRG